MPGDPRLTPLLQSDRLGGTLTYDDVLERGPLGLSRNREVRPHLPTNREYTLAARIQGNPRATGGALEAAKTAAAPGRDVHVIVIADLDLVSDFFFAFRRQRADELAALEFDNVTFALNCVDVLAGDETFLELRKKRPTLRTLAYLEAELKKYIDQSLEEGRKVDEEAKTELDAARKRLRDAVDGIRNSTEYDERTKESIVQYREQVESRRLGLDEARIKAQKEQADHQSLARKERSIAGQQNKVRMQALLVHPLPVIVLGIAVFFVRRQGEYRGANPDRIA
jgi:ABC-2 type transport system permease protein